MNVLSLFDGMSCGQLALKRAGINYRNYYASEIDKWAIKVTQHHFPGTVQLGSVTEVNGFDFDKIDLLIGGSPCQGFSLAGRGLNFKDPRSKLFFEYVRVLNEVRSKNPDLWFLLENVKMKKDYEKVINKLLGVRPLRFNSKWVSAQNRERLYWTNIPVNNIPEDRKVFLEHIIEEGTVDRQKSYCIDANYYKGGNEKNYFEKGRRQLVSQSTRRNQVTTHSLQPRTGKGHGGKGPLKKTDGKSYCLDTGNGQAIEFSGIMRKLTVKECCRLQTVPENYFEGIVSNTQAYKMLGNGWTIDMIAFILSFIKPAYT